MEKEQHINQATQLLRSGELVAIPTETVYGLAANALDKTAVSKIFEAKGRPTFDPLIVHVKSAEALKDYAQNIPDVAFKLAEAFWPGPLTLILEKRDIIPYIVTSGNDTVGLRMPNHPLTLELLQQLEFPLAAPSANPFGYVSPTEALHVEQQLGEKVKLVLDGGACKVGVESTIVKCYADQVEVLRLGGLPVESIEEVIGKPVDQIKTSSSNPQAPGMLSSHYSPLKPLYFGSIRENLERFHPDRVGIIWFENDNDILDSTHQRVLSPNGDLNEAAANLFRFMRELDAIDVDVILAEPVPDEGLGRAINDRLKRASHPTER
tara:strand:- start:999 stop:1964 length:966 start_codon:yes stop_codon:yes gene_type:complete